jgi:hypothetical protein
MLVLENLIVFAASCGRLKLWHSVEQVMLKCLDDGRAHVVQYRSAILADLEAAVAMNVKEAYTY